MVNPEKLRNYSAGTQGNTVPLVSCFFLCGVILEGLIGTPNVGNSERNSLWIR